MFPLVLRHGYLGVGKGILCVEKFLLHQSPEFFLRRPRCSLTYPCWPWRKQTISAKAERQRERQADWNLHFLAWWSKWLVVSLLIVGSTFVGQTRSAPRQRFTVLTSTWRMSMTTTTQWRNTGMSTGGESTLPPMIHPSSPMPRGSQYSLSPSYHSLYASPKAWRTIFERRKFSIPASKSKATDIVVYYMSDT